jgi:hypothetical protein
MYLKILAHPVFVNLNFHMPMIVDLSHLLRRWRGKWSKRSNGFSWLRQRGLVKGNSFNASYGINQKARRRFKRRSAHSKRQQFLNFRLFLLSGFSRQCPTQLSARPRNVFSIVCWPTFTASGRR